MLRRSRSSKTVDYTFASPVRNPEVKAVYDHVTTSQPLQTITHTTDPFTKRTALFSGVEVKQSNGGNTEALVQLTIWLVAGLEKLLQLGNLRDNPLSSHELPPALGWTVIGHYWHLYIAFRGTFEGED